jgi:hypothetical protein
MDWSTVPVEDEGVMDERQKEREIEKSVLSDTYRPRSPLGAQEVLGLGGAIVGGMAGVPLGPAGVVLGSAAGAGAGGALGEGYEQVSRDEPLSTARMGEAGVKEALWDLGGNLVFKVGGQLVKATAAQLGFSKDTIPDATKAAEEFLNKQGSGLPKPALYDSGVLRSAEGLVTSPTTSDIFKAKEQEIKDALMSGQKGILNKFVQSPEFEMALKQGTSPQRASGEVLQSFVKNGEAALSQAVDPIYKEIFKDKQSSVSMFSAKNWAQGMLTKPAELTQGQKSILKEVQNLPPQVDIETLHKIRSRWLAESRDKYSATGSEKDSRSVSTIKEFVTKMDEAMNFAAERTLDKDNLAKYRSVTKEYREGIQGLQNEAITKALQLRPEEVGGYLFQAGNETPINDLLRSLATAQKYSKKSSNEILEAMRYGYLDALTNTPENMLKFGKELEQNKNLQNTFKVMFSPEQQKAIKDMTTAAQLGLVQPESFLSSTSRGTAAVYGIGGASAAGLGYAFVLSDEQQQKVKESLGETALAGGSLILSQRLVAKMLLDPKGAKTLSLLSQAKNKLKTPSAFTKLVVEPLANYYAPPSQEQEMADFLTQGSASMNKPMDWSSVPTAD